MRAPRPGLPWSQQRVAIREKYSSYMSSPAWFARREAWLNAEAAATGDGPKCAVCGAAWTLKHGDLHHLSYDQLGNEAQEDLVALCRADHNKLHQMLENGTGWSRVDRRRASLAIIHRLKEQRAARQE